MNAILCILEANDYLILALIGLTTAVAAGVVTRQQINLRRLERKLDALLAHHGVATPARMSPEVQALAADPRQKIAAIKLHREQNPELSLAEAKAEIEAFSDSRR